MHVTPFATVAPLPLNFNLPSELWSRRVKRFDVKYDDTCGGSFVNYGNNVT